MIIPRTSSLSAVFNINPPNLYYYKSRFLFSRTWLHGVEFHFELHMNKFSMSLWNYWHKTSSVILLNICIVWKYIMIATWVVDFKSFMTILNKTGGKTDPWCTPFIMRLHAECFPMIIVLICLPCRKHFIHSSLPFTPFRCSNFHNSLLCDTIKSPF